MPLDTSKLPADQRLPPYSYSQPGLLLQSQPSQKALHQSVQSSPQPALPPAPPTRPPPPPVPPSGAAQRPYPPQYQPNASLQQQQQQQPLGQSLSDFGLGSVSAPGMGTLGGAEGGGTGGILIPIICFFPQFEQFGMGESPTGNSGGFPEELGTLSYPPTEGTYDPHVLNRQNLSNCSRHGPIPNIILTGGSPAVPPRGAGRHLGGAEPPYFFPFLPSIGDSPPGISKEIATALAGVPGFEVDAAALGLEEDLKIEPLTLDGLNMLSDPYALLTDPAVEDSFRTDRLQ